MIYLILSVICTAMLVLAFKIFNRRQIPVFQAIVFNYISATLCAFVFLPDKQAVLSGHIFAEPWVPFALFLGSMFIGVFNLTAITTGFYGVSTASVAMKLGLVFPVLLAFTVYGEPFDWMKLAGIVFAFAAVILCSVKEDGDPVDTDNQSDNTNKAAHHSSFAILPVIVFIGSGACDSLTQLANKKYVSAEGMEGFSFFLFATTAVIGMAIFIYQLARGKAKFHSGSLAGGVLLGIANYFSFLFLLKALATVPWGSSVVFPVSNLGTVALATLAGIVFFKEKISKLNMLGLAFAAVSIGLIVWGSV